MSGEVGTPRTDAATCDCTLFPGTQCTAAEVSRALERDSAALRADRDALVMALRRIVSCDATTYDMEARFCKDIAKEALKQHGGTV